MFHFATDTLSKNKAKKVYAMAEKILPRLCTGRNTFFTLGEDSYIAIFLFFFETETPNGWF
ncbi:MAG: hypothetical protein CVU44_11840 [Chloroflexi bacterium HGW-Chloroflexi-6]|nr:MAG: hypothetical protein CVU44_11840 [Chloroflexi bacterium HGW-Chloroflexi-6]